MIQPQFNDLNKPETIINHIAKLTDNSIATSHPEILNKLIEQFEPLDFYELANTNRDDDFKLKQYHLLIISIENGLT